MLKKLAGIKFYIIMVVLGGTFLPVGDAGCTHLVVEENSIEELPTEGSFDEVSVVRQEVSLIPIFV